MDKIIGVQFQKNGKLYYFDANGFEPKPGDFVVVDTVRGYDLGEVAMSIHESDAENRHTPLKKTIRIATEQDIQHCRDNRLKEKEAFAICQKKISEHKLEMKLVSVEYAFDNSKILFFFTANGRVDFRSLVKDLASIFKMRIELRQIGVRDEAKMLGGLGPCGRPICCGSFLDQFQPVSIKMAKEQNLSLNPTKISGVCGRLMCCLKYEQEHYEITRRKMPKIGREVVTPDGKGPVTDLNIIKESVFVRLTNGDTNEIKEYPLEEIFKGTDDSSLKSEKKEYDNSEQKDNIEPTPEVLPKKTDQPGSADNTDEKKPTTASEMSTADRARSSKKNRRGTLGQPVKRENPNRADGSAKNKETKKPSYEKATKTSEVERNTDLNRNINPQKNLWADALQKAMQAINQDK